ncbi:S8 family peptidase [Pseudomonas putida]|nr:S8 family peptidase [Pseudomonas putida]EKT8865599.1 S8 family peptidase [Pseudomonas putida]
MPEKRNQKRAHLILPKNSEPRGFTAHPPKGGTKPQIPNLPTQQHGAALQHQLQALRPAAEAAKNFQEFVDVESGLGLQIQFVGQPDVEMAFQSLGDERKKIELLSVRQEGDQTIANVFVPDGKLDHFEKIVTGYLAEKKDKNGNSRDHRNLVNTIESIRSAELEALWTDDPALLPEDKSEEFWWEVWLPVRGARLAVINDFKKIVELSGCEVSEARADFPERSVVLMRGSQLQLSQSVVGLNCVAELRRAKETADSFDDLAGEEQIEWLDELVARTDYPPVNRHVPRICLLDSGVNRAHPLLSPLIEDEDTHTVDPEWGRHDEENHGTGMAALAAYGDLTDCLSSLERMSIDHRLESVKLLPSHGANEGSALLHASLFAEGVARPEISHADRSRIFNSAVSAEDYRDRGRPSSWSSKLDSLAADADNEGEFPRLFIQSAGNIRDNNAWMLYPSSLSTNLIHDPGQAWNALTVGACTRKTDTRPTAYEPIALEGGLSPFTTTSATWESAWPLKPDVVFEGGNAAKDQYGAAGMASLNLLTAKNEFEPRRFCTFNATSAASALCSRMAAQILVQYPNLRPETVRALIVHSAEWSEAMRQAYLPVRPVKADYVNLIRHAGWGEPSLERALWSASNSLTLVVEDQVYPYKKGKGKIDTRDMNLHNIPWPKDELEALQGTEVEMKVTLSYFVEPNPSARGSTSKYHYPSHRLRFDVKRPLEGPDEFVGRVNAAAEQVNEGTAPKDPDWILGGLYRHKGSLHQDIWKGTAADLASRGMLAVFPGMGWWRTRPNLQRYNLPARYSLIISIKTPETDVDIYTPVEQRLAIMV